MLSNDYKDYDDDDDDNDMIIETCYKSFLQKNVCENEKNCWFSSTNDIHFVYFHMKTSLDLYTKPENTIIILFNICFQLSW